MPLRITQTFGYDGRLTPDYFAIKMEIFLKEAWESGYYSIEIGAKAPDNSIAYSYTCNWEPWSDTTLDGSFSTPHWETVQVPMEEFRLTGTENTYLQSYSQIRTINYMDWTFSNPESEEGGKYIPEISVAIDNIRLIQVKSSE
jgi:hypothetical protein